MCVIILIFLVLLVPSLPNPIIRTGHTNKKEQKRSEMFHWLRAKTNSIYLLQEVHCSNDTTSIWNEEKCHDFLHSLMELFLSHQSSHQTRRICNQLILLNFYWRKLLMLQFFTHLVCWLPARH